MDRVDEVTEVAPEAIEFPDDQRVVLAHRFGAGFQAGTVILLARGGFRVSCRF